MFLLGRFKEYLIVAAVVAKAMLLAFVSYSSYQRGKNKAEVDRIKDANQSLQKKADFHSEMARHEQDIRNSKLHDRGNLVDRLRDNGL
jgi:Ni/Co efflux regulator RcnB